MFNFRSTEYKGFVSLNPKAFYTIIDCAFRRCAKTTDTYYNNAKELSKILYNKRICFRNEDGVFVTLSKITCNKEDKMELIKVISKELNLDSQKLLLSLEVHHRTLKEVEKVISNIKE